METSTIISIGAIIISLFALKQSFDSHKATIILSIESKLKDQADICNKYLVPETLMCTSINQEVSEIVTSIINAKKLLAMSYRNYGFLLLSYNQKDLLRYFYFRLHTSIIEMIKNPLSISNYDPYTTPKIEEQQLECRKFLQSIINENADKNP